MLTIYHNTACSKSTEAFCLLEANLENFRVIEYLKNPLNEYELKELIKKLGIEPEELVRKKEPVFEEKYKDRKLTADEWIKAMVEDPILIERPIVVDGEKAMICRPPEKLLEWIS